jgi:hypothetical protein
MRSRGAMRPGRTRNAAPKNQRAQGKPGARCTRGLVCKVVRRNAHEHTGSAESIRPSLRNGFTAYGVLSPATNSSCHRHRRISGFAKPGWARKISADLTPATDARTTRFCRTQQPVFAKRLAGLWRRRLARCCPLTRELALRTHARRRCRVHRIPSRVRDDRDTPLLPGKDGASW